MQTQRINKPPFRSTWSGNFAAPYNENEFMFFKSIQLAGGKVGKGIETPPQNTQNACLWGKHFFEEILSQIFKKCWLVVGPPQTAPPPINKPLQQPTAL